MGDAHQRTHHRGAGATEAVAALPATTEADQLQLQLLTARPSNVTGNQMVFLYSLNLAEFKRLMSIKQFTTLAQMTNNSTNDQNLVQNENK